MDQQSVRKVVTHNYPEDSIIEYSESGRSYTYNIIEEGNYPPAAYLKYTKQKNPVYWIYYGNECQYQIKSEKSSSDAASLYTKALDPETKTRYSGPHVFGLQLEVLQQARDTKRRATTLKPFNNLTITGQNNRAKKIAKSVHAIFDQTAIKSVIHKPILKSIEFNIKDQHFYFSIGKEDVEDTKHKARATVEACDKGQITRGGYQNLASVCHNLPREWLVFSERKKITQEIKDIIPISLINMSPSSDNSVNSEVHIDDVDIINNVQQSIGKGGRRNIIDILKYLIPGLIKKGVIHVTNPKIHLRISGDGRNVGKKVKHVMVTFSILDDKDTLQQPDSHYTIALYSDIEKYEMLHTALEYLIMELRKLKEEGLIDDQGIKWKFDLYFSSDWKFLVICLGMNAVNSKCFCPWCEISKEQQGNFSYEWTISKNMDQVCENYKFSKGHIQPPLFDMIPLQNWVPDELHMMLCITDVLWRLVIDELKSRNTWGDKASNVIVKEMKCICVRFHFWLEEGSTNWQYTSLMGQDKLTVLQHFDLGKLFPHSRAVQIRSLWNNFYLLHNAVKDPKTDVIQFSNDARAWLHQFLDSSFYQTSDITPYMHVLVYHIPEMMHIHRRFGLAAFSCSAVEKKTISKFLTSLEKQQKMVK
ncbi:hypothetical protein RclHR1_07480003 [Rhizophagus clarus]|uniref:Uncharacterized protein n=1 Tax=Rhizophagus clarus TaxID=94130 RepID=A0A2Z6S3E0_9GLOM|nr:hypothetical protein RclHR1_07480003 [Rhizophagus clarus]